MNVAIICKARKGCLWSLLSMSDFAAHKLCKVHMASAHGKRVKGSVASVTRFRRPRAVSHQQTLLTAHSSSPLSEPSLKELHTRRAPLGLGRHMQATHNQLNNNCDLQLLKLAYPHVDVHCCAALCNVYQNLGSKIAVHPLSLTSILTTALHAVSLQTPAAASGCFSSRRP